VRTGRVRPGITGAQGTGSPKTMADDIFAEVQAIEAEAERLISEAHAKAEALAADAEGQIKRLQKEADRTFNREGTEGRRQHEARLAAEKHRTAEGFEALLARLETVRAKQVQPLADWLIERLLDADREH
jgi:F0F1-type ATP synthase membrane subunit b/b'